LSARLRVLLAAAALATSGLALPSTAAHAVSVDVTCTGTETVAYDPGLLLAPRSVGATVHGILAPCASSDPAIASGTYLQSFTAVLSCGTVLAGLAATRIFDWSNGESSTFTYNRAINDVLGQTTVTFTGTITSGRFAGDTAIEQVVFATPSSLRCLAPPGLTMLGPGIAVLTIGRA
jgi:hypothetical protein